MGTGFSKRKKEAKALQDQLSKLKSQMDTQEVSGTAGNGLVNITLTGDYTIKQLKIKPECVDPEDVEGLQDLIKAAYHDAKSKLDSNSMKGFSGIPGLENFGF